MSFSENFAKMTASVRKQISVLQKQAGQIKESSGQSMHTLSQKWLETWEKTPQTMQKYKAILKEMPKELKKRPKVQKAIKELDILDHKMRDGVEKIRHIKASEVTVAVQTQLNDMDHHIDSMQTQLTNILDVVADLEDTTDVQRYLHGETILSQKTDLQWGRKIFHAFNGLFAAWLFYFSGLSTAQIWWVMGTIVAIFFMGEFLRFTNPKINNLVFRVFRPIMREGEKHSLNSATYYIISMATVYFLFPVEVAVLCLMFLALGDPVAGIIGIKFGKHPMTKNASVEGFLACGYVCALISYLFVGHIFDVNLSKFSLVAFSALAGIIAAVSEILFPKWDDNLVMPLSSCVPLYFLMKFFHII